MIRALRARPDTGSFVPRRRARARTASRIHPAACRCCTPPGPGDRRLPWAARAALLSLAGFTLGLGTVAVIERAIGGPSLQAVMFGNPGDVR